MEKSPFIFELGAKVRIKASSENGRVIARCEYETSQNHYLVRYQAGDGCARESFWGEDALDTFAG